MTVNPKKAEWEKENLRTLSCRIRKEDAERFQTYAKYRGTSVHGLFSEYVRKCLDNAGTITPEQMDRSVAMQNEIALLRRKLRLANEAVDQARARAVNAEALVDKWLRSADEDGKN